MSVYVYSHSGCEDDKKLKVDFKSIACKVCNAPSSGFHFGAITCEGCKVTHRHVSFSLSVVARFLITNWSVKLTANCPVCKLITPASGSTNHKSKWPPT